MSTQIQFRRGTAAEHLNFTGANGEITVNLTNNSLRVHDGDTVGGTETMLSNLSNITADGKKSVSMLALPSNEYVNMTLQPSGTVYTAPANGYINIHTTATASGNGFFVVNVLDEYSCVQTATSSTNVIASLIPIRSGKRYNIYYDRITCNKFRFIYAQGES